MTGQGFSASLRVWLSWLLAPPWLGRIVPGNVGSHLISSESWAPIRMYRPPNSSSAAQHGRNERHGGNRSLRLRPRPRYLPACQPDRCSSNFTPGTAAWQCPDVLATWNKGGPARSWRRRPGCMEATLGRRPFPAPSPAPGECPPMRSRPVDVPNLQHPMPPP